MAFKFPPEGKMFMLFAKYTWNYRLSQLLKCIQTPQISMDMFPMEHNVNSCTGFIVKKPSDNPHLTVEAS